MTPESASLNQKIELIALFQSLGAHSLWPPDSMQQWLRDCGVSVEADRQGDGLVVFSEPIAQIKGDWGRGIYAPHVLYAVLRHYGLDETVSTNMTGRGFAYNDLIEQLAVIWKLPKENADGS